MYRCSRNRTAEAVRYIYQGLDPEAVYYCDVMQREYTGEILMKGGLLIGDLWGDAVSRLYHFEKR